MIESVQARQRGAYDFESHYDNLCALQDSVPLAAVKANLSSGILDINADRVRAPDWPPIIHTLQINKSLEYVAIRSHFTPPSDTDDKRAFVMRRKTPSIRSKEITFRLCKALHSCLAVTPTLMFIELTGVPLRERDINVLMKGVLKNTTLVHLSFELCRIGDNGLEMICKGLRGNNKITSINLTGCSLTARGAELIAKLIKHQAMKRHTEAWRDSLRYGVPQMEKMPGLRRVTLNNNPLIGNQGAQLLAEALKDDLWIKALDMHGTGVSTSGAKAFLDVLKYNTTIEVLDLRRNPLIDRSVLHSIMEHLMINCNGKETEYQWIEPSGEEERHSPIRGSPKSRRRTTKILNSSIGKKTTIKITPGSARRRTKSASAMAMSRQEMIEAMKPTPGLPWRTAARAHRYRGFPPERTPRKPVDDGSDVDPDTTSILITREDSCVDQSLDTVTEMKMLEEDRLNADMQKRRERDIRDLHVEVEQLRRMLKEERLEKSKSDQRVMQLMMENRRLEDDLRIARLRSSSMAAGKRDTSVIQDESVLDSIESSFKQFHAFLDMLREAGLGELITMAGLNQDQMPFSRSMLRSPNKSFAVNTSALHNGAHRTTQQKDNLRPGSAGSAPAMSHIDNSAYLREKEEADEVYQRLLKQTSGAFTSAVTAKSTVTKPVVPLTQPSGDVPSTKLGLSPSSTPREGDLTPTTPHQDSPSDLPSAGRRDPTPTLESDKILKCPQDDPSPRPVPTPRQKPGASVRNEGDAADPGLERRVPSRASDANYSMDSFEQSYISERGEVVVLGDDADLLDSPNSRPINFDSEDEGF